MAFIDDLKAETAELREQRKELQEQLQETRAASQMTRIEQTVKAQQAWSREIRNSTKELAKLDKAANWRKMVTESGLVVASLRNIGMQAKDIGGRLRGIGETSATGFYQGRAALSDFMTAASPQAVEALSGWIGVLKAEIGSSFTPVLIDVIGWVRQLTDWWRGLSDETKTLITRVVFAGVALVGIGAIIPRVTAGLSAISAMARVAGQAFMLLWAHPWIAAIAAIGAAIWALSKAFEGATDAGEGLSRSMDQIEKNKARIESGKTTTKDLESLPDTVKAALAGGDRAEGEKAIKEFLDKTKENLEAAHRQQAELAADKSKVYDPAKDRVVPATKAPDAALLGRGGSSHMLEKEVKYREERVALAEAAKKRFEEGPGKGKSGADMFGGGSQAAFMALDQVRKNAIATALNSQAKPWEQEQLQVQYKQLEELRRIAAGERPGPPPVGP